MTSNAFTFNTLDITTVSSGTTPVNDGKKFFFLTAGEYDTVLERLEITWNAVDFAPEGEVIAVNLFVGGGSFGGLPPDTLIMKYDTHSLNVSGIPESSAIPYFLEELDSSPQVAAWIFTPDSTRQTFSFTEFGGYVATPGHGISVICSAFQRDSSSLGTNRSGELLITAYYTELS